MIKIRNALLLILLLAGIIYSGIKLYLHYKIKKQIDQIVQMATPYVDIKYGGISTTLEGDFFLENLKFHPTTIDDEISIDSLQIITPGLDFLLGNGKESVGQGQIPEKLGASIKGLNIDLNGALVEQMLAMEEKTLENSSGKGRICTFSQLFRTEQYKRLEIKELLINTAVKLNYDEDLDSMIFNMDFSLLGIEEINIKLTLEQFKSAISSIMVTKQSPPTLSSITINYRPDPKFMQQANQYCADSKGIKVEEFIDQLVNQSDDAYRNDLGFIPGSGIRKALKKILGNAGELVIIAQSDNPIDLSKLHLYKPEDIPIILGLSATIDGAAINDLSFTMDESAKAFLKKIGSKSVQGITNNAPVSSKITTQNQNLDNKENRKKLRYHIVQTNLLSKKIGLKARIKTKNGKLRRGQIIKVKENSINLKMPMRGGTMSVYIPIADITHLEVKEWL